jgi:hypothetical protein
MQGFFKGNELNLNLKKVHLLAMSLIQARSQGVGLGDKSPPLTEKFLHFARVFEKTSNGK